MAAVTGSAENAISNLHPEAEAKGMAPTHPHPRRMDLWTPSVVVVVAAVVVVHGCREPL